MDGVAAIRIPIREMLDVNDNQFDFLMRLSGMNRAIFMLMCGITLAPLAWMYWTENVPQRTAAAAATAPAAQRA